MKHYYVYILTNKTNKVLYTGVTDNLLRRIFEHKNKAIAGFTAKYNVNKLVYAESFDSPSDVIVAEKRIKGWLRKKKIALIESSNPQWNDLFSFIEKTFIHEQILRRAQDDKKESAL